MKKPNKYQIAVVSILGCLLAGSIYMTLGPETKISLSERRPLATRPQITKDAILTGNFMEDFETWGQDQFPLRETMRSLRALTGRYLLGQQDSHGIYEAEGHLSKMDPTVDLKSLNHAADCFRSIYNQYLADTDCQIYLSIIPDKNYYLAANHDYPAMDYNTLYTTMEKAMDYATPIDLTQVLSLNDYYNTDAHWRQENLIPVADTLMKAMRSEKQTGTESANGTAAHTSLANYTTVESDPIFQGVYLGQSAWPMSPEPIRWLTSPLLEQCIVYDYEADKQVQMYQQEKLTGQDAYDIYLGGPRSLITIENPEATTDQELILIRDSFGSSLAPLLMENYQKITLVDIRYMSPVMLSRFIEFKDQDILFLYSTTVLNNSITMKK